MSKSSALPVGKSALPSMESFLLQQKLITLGQVEHARTFMSESDISFGTAILFLKYVAEDRLARLLEAHFSVRHLSPGEITGLGKLKNLLTPERAKGLQVFPLTLIEESGSRVILLGMTDPLDIGAVRKVEEWTHTRVQPSFLTLAELQELYVRYYRTGLEIFPPEVTYYGEKVAGKRFEAAKKGERTSTDFTMRERAELKAMIHLLIEKGIFSLEDFQRAVTRQL